MKFPKEQFSDWVKEIYNPNVMIYKDSIIDRAEAIWNEAHEAYKAELRKGVREIGGGDMNGTFLAGKLYFRTKVLALLPKNIPNWPFDTPDRRKEDQRQYRETIYVEPYPDGTEGVVFSISKKVKWKRETVPGPLPDRRGKDRRAPSITESTAKRRFPTEGGWENASPDS